eukprot:5469095-Prymnesium_polylepis.1
MFADVLERAFDKLNTVRARSASALLAAAAAHCSSTSRQPARSPASPVRWYSSALPSRRSSAMFCSMLTGLWRRPPALQRRRR